MRQKFNCLSLLFASGATHAELLHNLPESVPPLSHNIYTLHISILWVCVGIGILVFGVMLYSIIKHRKSSGHKVVQFHEHTGLEILWTIISFLILALLAIPAMHVLKGQTSTADLTKTAVAAPATGQLSKQQLMQKGAEIYNSACAVCHQTTGLGMPPMYPALKGSALVNGPIDANLNRVLNGKPGTAMQAFKEQLDDAELAAVITYERNSWGNHASVVQPSEVAAARAKPPTGR